jgi:hypothetical protein
MTNDLCDLWRELAADPADAATRGRARARRDELFDHVDECTRCTAVTRSSPAPIELLEALADDDHGHAYDAARAGKWRDVIADERAEIEAAVREVLLPQLSRDGMLKFADIVSASERRPFSGLDLFRGSDAAALTIRAYPPRGQQMRLHMDLDGGVFANGKLEIPPASMKNEVARTARLDVPVAAAIVAWLPHAARSVPTLFLGIDAAPRGDQIDLKLVHRDNAERLSQRWTPRAVSTEYFFDLGALPHFEGGYPASMDLHWRVPVDKVVHCYIDNAPDDVAAELRRVCSAEVDLAKIGELAKTFKSLELAVRRSDSSGQVRMHLHALLDIVK